MKFLQLEDDVLVNMEEIAAVHRCRKFASSDPRSNNVRQVEVTRVRLVAGGHVDTKLTVNEVADLIQKVVR